MNTILIVSTIALWAAVMGVGFLLLGTLRSLGLLQWQVEQLQATQPSRINRNGLKPGAKAPEFSLPDIDDREASLSELRGTRTLLVFVQSGCKPCHAIVPELNQRQRAGEFCVVAVNNADPQEAKDWAKETQAEFPVLVQDQFEVSKQYQVFATPFAFLIDEDGKIASSGIISNKRHIDFVLEAEQTLQVSEQHVAKTDDFAQVPAEPVSTGL